jgi:Fe2+ or Zn2+ uptake regulation protein
MSDTTRRAYLHTVLQTAGHPVTTETAVQLLDGSPYAAGRNTIRKQLRGLARTGLLTITAANGRTTYHLISTTQGDR